MQVVDADVTGWTWIMGLKDRLNYVEASMGSPAESAPPSKKYVILSTQMETHTNNLLVLNYLPMPLE